MLMLFLLAILWLQAMMLLLLMFLGSPIAQSCDAHFACDFCHAFLAFAFM
jgi:hypothetical protein